MNTAEATLPMTRAHREKFFPKEDEQLKELVLVYGCQAWSVIASQMPGRNARQCRERWKHYLSSDKSKSAWTLEEDQLLYQKMVEFGPRWTALSQYFPGRTDMQIKCRWMHTFAPFSDLHLKHRQVQAPWPAMPVTPPPGYPGMILGPTPAFHFPALPFPPM
jgi:hypothetical protein